jgi:hypothetical protein
MSLAQFLDSITLIRVFLHAFLFFKDTPGEVHRFYRERGQDGLYNDKRLHDTNTTPHTDNNITHTNQATRLALHLLLPRMARREYTELLDRVTT